MFSGQVGFNENYCSLISFISLFFLSPLSSLTQVSLVLSPFTPLLNLNRKKLQFSVIFHILSLSYHGLTSKKFLLAKDQEFKAWFLWCFIINTEVSGYYSNERKYLSVQFKSELLLLCRRRAWMYLSISDLQQMVSEVINLSNGEGGENKS